MFASWLPSNIIETKKTNGGHFDFTNPSEANPSDIDKFS